jgi:hypothetical protein
MRVKFQDGAFPEARETRMFVARKLTAMYYLAYAHLPFYKNSPVFEWAWNKCIDHGLLTPTEAAALKAIPSECLLQEQSVLQRLFLMFV